MPTYIGSRGLYGLASMTIGVASLAGYVSPKFETLSVSGQADFVEELGQTGEVDQLVGVNRGITCQFRFKPRGSSETNARAALGIPDICAPVTVIGLPVIKAYGFADVFNTDNPGGAGNAQVWWFKGDFSIEPTSTGLWTASITMGRYIGITALTSIA